MTVKRLIELLGKCSPESEVWIKAKKPEDPEVYGTVETVDVVEEHRLENIHDTADTELRVVLSHEDTE